MYTSGPQTKNPTPIKSEEQFVEPETIEERDGFENHATDQDVKTLLRPEEVILPDPVEQHLPNEIFKPIIHNNDNKLSPDYHEQPTVSVRISFQLNSTIFCQVMTTVHTFVKGG
eukprot:sb/3476871/